MGDLFVRGGTVVTAQETFLGDVVIKGGRIVQVMRRSVGRGAHSISDIDDLPVLDATGKLVLPGLIDVHVHFRDPGLTHKEDFASGTAAAAYGGVTTVLDMPNTLPPVASPAVLQAKAQAVAQRAHVDYGLYALIDEHNLDELPGLAEAGAAAFKLFLGPTTGDLRAPGWGRLIEVFRRVGDIGLPFVIHAEDRDVIEYWQARVQQDASLHSPFTYADFLATRPTFGEVATIQNVCLLSRMTGTPVHIAHVTLKDAVDVIRQAKALGAPVSAETCPPYLTMTADDCEKIGPVSKILPPIRSGADRDGLWAGLHDGTIDMIATDHAPHEDGVKGLDWLQAAGGMIGVETMLPLLLREVGKGRLTLNELVCWTSAAPARVFRLDRRKGDLVPGLDGDVVVVDPDVEWTVKEGSLHSKSANTALTGAKLRGKVVHTVVRGQVVVEDGQLVGAPVGRPVV